MGEKKEPQQQHQIPRFLLENFVDKNVGKNISPYVWVFDKQNKIFKKESPNGKFFKENDFYTLISNNNKDYIIEKSLSKIESKFGRVLVKIKKRQSLLDEEHDNLCIFIASLFSRTNKMRDVMKDLIFQLENLRIGNLNRLNNTIIDKRLFNQNLSQSDENFLKMQPVAGLGHMANLLKQMSLAFICPKKGSNRYFIMTDEPCVMFNGDLQYQKFYSPGLAQKNIQFTIPITPDTLIMFSWTPFNGYYFASNFQIDDLNRTHFAYSNKYIVSHKNKIKWIWSQNYPLYLDPIFHLSHIFKIIKNLYYKVIYKIKYRGIYGRKF